jgi:hypothetical protein
MGVRAVRHTEQSAIFIRMPIWIAPFSESKNDPAAPLANFW